MLLENEYVLEFPDGLAFGDDEFFDFCQKNPELNIERDHFFNLIIRSPTGSLSGFINGQILIKLEFGTKLTNLEKSLIPPQGLFFQTIQFALLTYRGFRTSNGIN